ncbi:MAG: asparagine synthase (glutamine-hydrolyzing), partial [Rubricoccaceae bacterium]|nr:asparagine synthase (glutamine-hydrolyzing) [Rubricoccaceae bacterium]
SIIDLSPAGRQPMQTPDGRYTLVYNGEIYNFSELRLQLQSRGCQFRSRTDTEVLLHALVEWGTEALGRLNGMFAFALYDARERSLLLSRDRYGIKPLYFYRGDGVFLFASEVKSFLAHPRFRVELDLESLVEYFTFQNFFTERTLFGNVSLLPAGHWMRVPLDQAESPKMARYWDYHFESEVTPRRESDYLEELEYLFQQAVSRQLVGDRPVASYLSGGMDSGAITAIASPQIDEMLTFTVGFDRNSRSGLELASDERENAEHMSYLFGTRHYEVILKAGDMERCLPALVWHLEEPRVGQSYPNFYAANLASRFGKVVLAGTGGDELFGGYPWRYYRAVSNRDFEQYIDKYYEYWQRLIPNRTLWEIFAPVRDQVKHVWTRDIFRSVFHEHADRLAEPVDYVNHSLYLEARTFLHGLLVVEDKLSMAHGLETRVPFLDNDLVDFALRLPVVHKLGNLADVIRLNENEGGSKVRRYFEKTQDGKLLLRKLLGKYVPRHIAEGVKQGFSGPDNQWF